MPNFLKTRIPFLSPEVPFVKYQRNMKYQILRYFNISFSLGRNDRLSRVGSKFFLLKKLIIFVFSCMLVSILPV